MAPSKKALLANHARPDSLKISQKGWHWVVPAWIAGITGAATALAATIFGVWWYASRIEPYWVQWRQVPLPIRGLPTAFDGYRIVQLSDFHLGKGQRFTPKRLAEIIARVNRLRPDVVALTGDFVSHFDPVSEAGIAELAALQARDGVLCVPGNHDYWNGESHVEQAVDAAGGEWLINCAKLINRGGAQLVIAGVDDAWDGKPNLAQSLMGIDAQTPVILLAHEPNFADITIRDDRVAVQLSGHSHGGQVRLPGFGPVALPDQAWRYPMGLYHVPRSSAGAQPLLIYTNRGLGMSEMAYRLFCRPEVSIFTLRSV
jgi:hypothetical protein